MERASTFFLGSYFAHFDKNIFEKKYVSVTCFLLRCPAYVKRWIFVFNLLNGMSFFLCIVWLLHEVCHYSEFSFSVTLSRKRADVARIVSRTDQMTEQKRPPQERVYSLLY